MNRLLALLLAFYTSIIFANTNNDFTDFFNSTESLSAEFNQNTFDEYQQLIASSKGTIWFKRPQQLLWHTHSPNDQKLLLTANELWLIDTELEQASLQKIDDLSRSPLYWLVNRPNELDSIPTYQKTTNGIDWYLNNENQQLAFGFKDGMLNTIKLNNELSQTIQVVLSNIRLNTNIKPSVFKLSLGPDFDVIR